MFSYDWSLNYLALALFDSFFFFFLENIFRFIIPLLVTFNLFFSRQLFHLISGTFVKQSFSRCHNLSQFQTFLRYYPSMNLSLHYRTFAFHDFSIIERVSQRFRRRELTNILSDRVDLKENQLKNQIKLFSSDCVSLRFRFLSFLSCAEFVEKKYVF